MNGIYCQIDLHPTSSKGPIQLYLTSEMTKCSSSFFLPAPLMNKKRFLLSEVNWVKFLMVIFHLFSAYSMIGQGYEINSAVVALSTEPKLKAPFKRPVIIASNNLDPVPVSCATLVFLFKKLLH